MSVIVGNPYFIFVISSFQARNIKTHFNQNTVFEKKIFSNERIKVYNIIKVYKY